MVIVTSKQYIDVASGGRMCLMILIMALAESKVSPCPSWVSTKGEPILGENGTAKLHRKKYPIYIYLCMSWTFSQYNFKQDNHEGVQDLFCP